MNIEVGKTYLLKGMIENGYANGKKQYTTESVVRRVTFVTDTRIICECGREFLREGLEIKEWPPKR
jgi:hypothetical protein